MLVVTCAKLVFGAPGLFAFAEVTLALSRFEASLSSEGMMNGEIVPSGRSGDVIDPEFDCECLWPERIVLILLAFDTVCPCLAMDANETLTMDGFSGLFGIIPPPAPAMITDATPPNVAMPGLTALSVPCLDIGDSGMLAIPGGVVGIGTGLVAAPGAINMLERFTPVSPGEYEVNVTPRLSGIPLISGLVNSLSITSLRPK